MSERAFLDFLKRTNCLCGICGNKEDTFEQVAYMQYQKAQDDGPSAEFTSVFDIPSTRYNSYGIPSEHLFKWMKQSYVEYGGWNLRQRDARAKLIWRRCPVNYRDLSYLGIPSPKRANGKDIGFVEHNVGSQVTEDDFNDATRYNQILEKNFKFGFFLKHMELQACAIGFWKHPFLQNPRFPTDLIDTWKYIENDATSLEDWVRVLSITSHGEQTAFLSFMQSSVRKYITDVRLEDDKYWDDEPAQQRIHLRNIIQLLTTTFNVCHNGLNNVWNHFSLLQKDYANLLTTVVNKLVRN